MLWTDQPGAAGWPGSGVCRQVTEGAPGRVTNWGILQQWALGILSWILSPFSPAWAFLFIFTYWGQAEGWSEVACVGQRPGLRSEAA